MTLRRFLTFLVTLAAFAWIVQASAASSGPPLGTGCIAHHPNYIEDTFEVQYAAGCSGHDEPELDPVSSAPGSARDSRGGSCCPVRRRLPGRRNRPDLLVRRHGQRPEQLVRPGVPRGAVLSRHDRPQVHTQRRLRRHVRAGHLHGLLAGLEHPPTGQKPVYHEPAAFNAMLTTGSSTNRSSCTPGTHHIHFHVVSPKEGWHIEVTEVTRGTGTIVLNSADGPLMPGVRHAKDRQRARLGRRPRHAQLIRVGDRPHFAVHASGLPVLHPGRDDLPVLQRAGMGRHFADPDQVGHLRRRLIPHVLGDCRGHGRQGRGTRQLVRRADRLLSYGGPFCIYPWYTQGSSGVHYGVDFPTRPTISAASTSSHRRWSAAGPSGRIAPTATHPSRSSCRNKPLRVEACRRLHPQPVITRRARATASGSS